MSITRHTIASLRPLIKAGKISPVEILEEIAREVDARDPAIRSHLGYDLDEAKKRAAAADLSGSLGGVPIAFKDVLNAAGQPCTCGSRMLENYVAPYDATVIEKVRKAGGIPFGRLNMDEFAMGSSTENSAFFSTRNPHDTTRVPGGSSGGSAAAVAADLCIAALGSDTGGSVRQPAAFCGCVGMKPTYGRVSRYGLVAYASSLDQVGTLTKTAEDAAILLGVISGHDAKDSTSLSEPVPDYTSFLKEDLKGLRLGLPKEYFTGAIRQDVRDNILAAVKQMEELGASVREVSLPHTEYAVAAYYIIAPAEASANLARFDGVRYGHRAGEGGALLEMYERSREEGFGAEVKRRIILGTYVLSSGYYDAFYLKAQKVRALIRQDFVEAFKDVDALISPTAPMPAFKIGEKVSDPLQMYLADICTIAANLAGICGMSIPSGFVEEEGVPLPVGVQLLGPALGEGTLLRIAHAFQRIAPQKCLQK